MLLDLHARLRDALRSTIRTQWNIDPPEIVLNQTPKIEFGELATPVPFELARLLKRPPQSIAEELIIRVGKIDGVERMEPAGRGYINFFLDRAAVVRGSRLRGYPGDEGKIIVEHTNINPNNAAHIGHLRNAAIGDTFVRILKAAGRKVEVQNYIDNTGVQVADVIVGLKYVERKTLDDVRRLIANRSIKFDYHCWDVYARVASFYEAQDPHYALRAQVLKEIEEGSADTAPMAELVAMTIVRCHLRTMARINVHYDLLPRESDILHLHFWDKAFHMLKENGAIYFAEEGKNRGCWVMRAGDDTVSEAGGGETEEDEKIIVRSDGTVTYVGKDIAYQLWKFGLLGLDFYYRPLTSEGGHTLWTTSAEDVPGAEPPAFGRAQRVYNVIDTRQSYLQNIVLQGLRALGYEEQARNSVHFSYEIVALSPACCEELGFELSDEDRKRPYVEVSGRKGLGVKADDLLDALLDKALAEVQSRHNLPKEQAGSVASIIAVGALRYFLLRFARNTVIAFDFKEALSFDGETGPYVQYAAVRANSIFRKLAEAEGTDEKSVKRDAAALQDFLESHDDIWELVYQAARLPEVARQVTQTMELAQLAKYAFHLAQRFNLFYHKYHILSEADPLRKQQLLLVAGLVRTQLEKALDLLGCEVPPKM